MFAQIVECQAKNGRREELSIKAKNDVLPILQGQPGFVDLIARSHKTSPERLLYISLWEPREGGDSYHRDHYDTISDMLKPILKTAPTLETFTVSASTAHNLAVERAA